MRTRVAVVATTPATVLDDVGTAMRLAGLRDALDPNASTLLKINVSWQLWYPAVSTTPWQLDGVIQTLKDEGYPDLIACHNGTVVVDAKLGEINNKHLPVVEKHGIRNVHLEDEQWIRYEPKSPMRVLGDIFPEGLTIPAMFPGKNIVHLPTMKTHVFTTMTGAMKNAFGGLLNHKRHWTHSVIHETLVDLLAIQKEIHPGLFAVTDGTFVGDGPGPRAMQWHTKNVILASADQVAIDAIAAKMMGIDPLSVKFIRLAHEAGLGVGDPREIDVVGEDISGVNWHLKASEETFAS
ncbi:MAG: DUF362 domain-containing protein, partial [Chloroflexi bacterium]|nr:DUF362 domain-containing protein [Chloroflexota bacterium]